MLIQHPIPMLRHPHIDEQILSVPATLVVKKPIAAAVGLSYALTNIAMLPIVAILVNLIRESVFVPESSKRSVEDDIS